MRDVYIHGVGSTKFGEHPTLDAVDMAIAAIEIAIADAGTALDTIDAIYVGNMLAGILDGQNHIGAHIAERLGVMVPVYRMEAACASGGMAVNLGWQAVAGGQHDTVLVVGTESMTKAGTLRVNEALKNAASNAERISGIGFAGLYGIMARAYIDTYNLPESGLWWGPAVMHRNACDNPHAQYKKAFTPEQIGQSRMISAPLRLLECSPHTDGAAAVILTSEPMDIQMVGSELTTDAPGLAERSTITQIPAAHKAWQRIQETCGIDANTIDVVELHDCFSIGGVMALEDLEFADRGKGSDLLRADYEGHNCPVVINPSGGLKACGHPVGATGVKQIVSIATYLRTHDTAQHGLTHNIGGTGGTAVVTYMKKV